MTHEFLNGHGSPALHTLANIDASTRKIPTIVYQLNDWQYVERAMHRMLCGWGGHHRNWDDKSALHQHVWGQAEIVRRLRTRIAEFPGGKPDAAVSDHLEKAMNAFLLAPSFEDFLDGAYSLLLKSALKSYVSYVKTAHPVHDAPTVSLLHEINMLKEQQWMWYRDYRRRNPHKIDAAYAAKLENALAQVNDFRKPIPVLKHNEAQPCGLRTDFQILEYALPPEKAAAPIDPMPYIRTDFSSDVEARRLFWAIGYMREKALPDDQLAWIYSGHYMPWDWHHDVSRHLWDESRHGDSGMSRLKDFGIKLHEVGYYHHSRLPGEPIPKNELSPEAKYRKPFSKEELYEKVFFIGLIAENSHFIVKNEAYDDFRDAEDFESAEMMLFDIIDETTHVQYAHRWLGKLADEAGVDNTDYRKRAARERKGHEENSEAFTRKCAELPREAGCPEWDHYQSLLQRIRERCPIKEADFKRRSPLPM